MQSRTNLLKLSRVGTVLWPTPVASLFFILFFITFFEDHATAALAVERHTIARSSAKSQVPQTTAQGRFLAPQAISTVDVSADGRFITVGTMAFSHDANVWQFAPD